MDLLREINDRQTKFSCIKRKAQENPEEAFTSLAHHLTEEYLLTNFRKLKKNAASGLDGVDGHEYEFGILERIENLHSRLKTQRYQAPNIKRVWIDKGDGKQRPLGISTTEDKIVQRAVADILNLIYEQDFHNFSYGFREKRSAHQALAFLRTECMKKKSNWIIDADIQGCFDNFDHEILLSLLSIRIKDKNILRLIEQWLKVGIVDGESMHVSRQGTPQGNIISPLLCNVYLHYVLDEWIENTIRPLMKGEVFLLRYADDFVIGLEYEQDAYKLMQVLPKRMSKYGLTIHPEKTQLLKFMPKAHGKYSTFDFLGFTHYWGKMFNGKWYVKKKTSKKKMQSITKDLKKTCRENKHEKLRDQSRLLKQKLRGLYQYFGVRGNYISIYRMYDTVIQAWFKWLNRRSQRHSYTWDGYWEMLRYFDLPKPKIIHKNV